MMFSHRLLYFLPFFRRLCSFRNKPSDVLDAMTLTWFSRGNASSFTGLSFDFLALVAGLVIAGLNGAGSNLTPGSSYATAQVFAVFSIQIGTSLYVYILKPSADRIDNCM